MQKKYISPQINVNKFNTEDVIMTSATTLATTINVNGKNVTAENYGSVEFGESIWNNQ